MNAAARALTEFTDRLYELLRHRPVPTSTLVGRLDLHDSALYDAIVAEVHRLFCEETRRGEVAMWRTCGICERRYNDKDQSTICPHHQFLSPTQQARKDLAIALLGKIVRWHHDAAGQPVRITSVTWDGMVTVEGQRGEFAPHLFREAVSH